MLYAQDGPEPGWGVALADTREERGTTQLEGVRRSIEVGNTGPLSARVRAAVLIVHEGRILLVKHVHPQRGDVWWIPPGGGLLPNERSIVDCAKRETFEETGLHVSVGRLAYLRDFIDEAAAVHHVEHFFLCEGFSGVPTIDNARGAGPDEDWIQDVQWLSKEDVQELTVWPEHLKGKFWDDLALGFPGPVYLGVQAE